MNTSVLQRPAVRLGGGGVVKLLGTWSGRMRERAALAALDDRVLEDIGLTRKQVETEAAKPFWRA